MHVSDAVEQRNTKIISELPAGISFNFLFDGTIDFIIGNQKYQLKKAANMMSHSNFIIVNKNEFFTRHLKQGMHIKKLNIFVEQAWLVKRCNNQADQRVMATFFQQPGVHQWQPDKDILQQAEALIKLNSPNAFGTKLISEQLVLGLLTACLEQAYKHLHHNDNQDASLEAFSTTLKDNVDQALTRCFSLPELANQLNMSVSTLQRHFKRDYGINISSYIKLRKLKQARRSLVVDNLSIGEVAFASGYNHVSNFIIAFKKQFGVTPAAYVKLHRTH